VGAPPGVQAGRPHRRRARLPQVRWVSAMNKLGGSFQFQSQ
jgi:hypothetical protein